MKNFITKLIGIILLIAIFELVYLFYKSNPLFVSPIKAIENAIILLGNINCLKAILFTTFRILIGFFIALVLGTVCAILSCKNKWFEFFISPIVNVIKITPIVSFIIIALVYIDNLFIVSFISFLMTFPIFYFNVKSGIKNVDVKLLEMAKMYKLNDKEILKNIYVKSVMPNFISAIKSSIGFSFKSGITAEVLVLPRYSLGINLYNSKIYLDTLNLFSYTIIIICVSLTIEYIMLKFLEKGGFDYDKIK